MRKPVLAFWAAVTLAAGPAIAADLPVKALRSDPANPHLNLLLASTHQRKVEVLRQVVRLTT